jgi:hypothetical protein
MSEFYLCQIALVGARMAAFHPYGFRTRNDLAMRRIVPRLDGALEKLDDKALQEQFSREFPIWIHNIVTDPMFPMKQQLAMPLRRFEGELSDSKANDVVAAVLSAGFRNETLNPLALPDSMPLRQRCAMVAHIEQWQSAYLALERDVIDVFITDLSAIVHWIEMAGRSENTTIEYSESA